jgi:hypothetical protein
MNLLRKRFLILTCLTTSLVLTGCGNGAGTYKGKGDGETLLNSQNQQMQTADADDPMAAHLRARAQVDPKDLSTHHPYTTTPTPEEVDKDTNVRVVRLENQVSDLQSDFKKLIPHISKANEEKLEAEQALAMNGQMANTPRVEDTMPDAVPAQPQKTETVVPASADATSTVTGVRIGEHEDRTRLVLDMNAPGKFSYDINGTSLTILLPQSSWTAATEKSLSNSPMIAGYKVSQGQQGGVALNVELRKPGKLTMSSALPPNDTYGNRIVFDVAPL